MENNENQNNVNQAIPEVKTEETLIESAIRALLAGPKKTGNR